MNVFLNSIAPSCSNCAGEVTGNPTHCPHCDHPQHPANVVAAEHESAQLAQRYQEVLSKYQHSASVLTELEKTVSTQSHAVIARKAEEVFRLATSDTELYTNHHQLVGAGFRRPIFNMYDQCRETVDSALFPGYKNRIIMAALSLTETSLPYYGDCHFRLKTSMIETRASVFDSNSLLFVLNQGLRFNDSIPPGYRATWAERGRLAVAKHAHEVSNATQTSEFAAMILQRGITGNDDKFIEVHIHGTISIHTIASVSLQQGPNVAIREEALEALLKQRGIPLYRF